MKHRHLSHEGYTLAAIDDILERGLLPEWAPLLHALRNDPYGEMAAKVEKIISSREIYGAGELFKEALSTFRARYGERQEKEPPAVRPGRTS